MPVATRVKQSSYHDSVTLMLAASELLKLPGVLDAAVVMGTAANKQIVAHAGLLTPESASAHPDDLLIIVRSIDATMGVAGLDKAEALLADRRMQGPEAKERRPRSLENALANAPGANLAVISVAGRYATQEAREAIARGLHVFLFSDNVSLEDEVALKALAAQRGLLLMGPDAGTAIINGIALGFGNAVPRGPVGLVSASGTGLQAVTSGLARAGTGISQAIGVGSRDLDGQVGGVMTLAGLRALQSDPETKVIVLISKPPGRSVVEKVLGQVRSGEKPAVVCLLGEDPALIRSAGALAATDLTQAATAAAALAMGRDPEEALAELEAQTRDLTPLAGAQRAKMAPDQTSLRGLFAGGTFCYEAQLVLRRLGEPIYSNVPLDKALRLRDSTVSMGHTCVDLGEDEFTQGRLHPMIDPSLRNRRILQEARDPDTAVILLDVELGFGVHPDPAGALVESIISAQQMAQTGGRHVCFVASVCGTEEDPQRRSRQESALRAAGVIVMPDNATAARLAGLLTRLPIG